MTFGEKVLTRGSYVRGYGMYFFTQSYLHKTYQNYEQPCQRSDNSDCQSHFSTSKIDRIFPNFFLRSKMLFLLLLSSRQCFFKQCMCVWFNAKLASKIFTYYSLSLAANFLVDTLLFLAFPRHPSKEVWLEKLNKKRRIVNSSGNCQELKVATFTALLLRHH